MSGGGGDGLTIESDFSPKVAEHIRKYHHDAETKKS